jgi:hypothetical protein
MAENPWKAWMADNVARVDEFWQQISKMEADALTHARAAIDEYARMSKETIAYAAQLNAEWRKAALDATKRSAAATSA